MPERWIQVRRWRERANELRQAAEQMTIPSVKDGLEQSAKNYERMAAELEAVLKEQGIEPALD
jgi:lysophospholipase L1-like esterase